MKPEHIALIYFAAVSLLAFVLTVYDKIAAVKLPRHRIPERTLIYIAFAGGAVVMLLTMLSIRHKTKHKKFMITLPVLIAIQLIALVIALYF